MKINSSLKGALCTVALALLASSASAALVTWNLNPSNLNQSVGSTSNTYTSSGFSITAYGFDNSGGNATPATLYYKAQPMSEGANETGLGLLNSPFNEVNSGANIPNFIQFDLSGIIAAGLTDGQIAVASLQNGEGYKIYGSNTLGVLGTQIGGPLTGLSFDDQFVNIPDFASYDFISIVAATGNVLPFALQANMPAVPEIGGSSAAFVLLAFFGVVMATRKIRARYNG